MGTSTRAETWFRCDSVRETPRIPHQSVGLPLWPISHKPSNIFVLGQALRCRTVQAIAACTVRHLSSIRAEGQASMSVLLPDAEGEIGPVPTGGSGHIPTPELDRLSNILKAFNEQFGNIEWKDTDKIRKVISEEIPQKVAADKKYRNAMKNSDKQNARIEHDLALERVVVELLSDHTELYKLFSENPAFKKWLSEAVFAATYHA